MADLYYSSISRETSLNSDVDEVATSISVVSTLGLPVQFPYKLIVDRDQPTEEVMYVTAAAGTVLTVQRGRDGTVGQAHTSGATVVHGATGDDFQRAADHRDATTGVHGLDPGESPAPASELADAQSELTGHIASTSAHGVSGNIVGTSGAQTLTGKIISGDDNSLFVPWSQVGPRAYIRRTKLSADTNIGAGNVSKLQSWETQRSFGSGFEHPHGTGTVRVPHTGTYLMIFRVLLSRSNTNQTGGVFVQMRYGVTSTADNSGSVIRSRRVTMGTYMGSGARQTVTLTDFVALFASVTYSFTVYNSTGHSLTAVKSNPHTSWSLMYFGPSAGTDELPEDDDPGGSD